MIAVGKNLKYAVSIHEDIQPQSIDELPRCRRTRSGCHRAVVSVYVPVSTDLQLLAEALEELIEAGWAAKVVAKYRESKVPRLTKEFFGGLPMKKSSVRLKWAVPAPLVRAIIYEVVKMHHK